jgi:hypothetical protein
MAKTALTQLQEQIEAVRREAYAAGYAAAMQSVRDFTSHGAPQAETPAPARRRGAAADGQAAPARRRQPRAAATAAAARGSGAARRPQRGTNAKLVEEVLQAMAPRAVRPTEIRSALRDKGVAMAFTSIRHALGQLEARQMAEQLADSRSWRYRGDGAGPT